jgi:hypothetical protein
MLILTASSSSHRNHSNHDDLLYSVVDQARLEVIGCLEPFVETEDFLTSLLSTPNLLPGVVFCLTSPAQKVQRKVTIIPSSSTCFFVVDYTVFFLLVTGIRIINSDMLVTSCRRT